MIKINNEQNCCGCGACVIECTQKCISMVEATLGAKIARVDATKCIHCKKCEQVCPMEKTSISDKEFRKEAYIAYALDSVTRNAGASGGIATLIANDLFQSNYCVYGAAFDEHLKLRHIRAENTNDLRKMSKSKYLQSDMCGIYTDVLNKLQSGLSVLFIGTPCQNHAMKNFIPEKHREKLMLIDFFCHGVPSQRFFDECLEYEDASSGDKTVEFSFRVKPSKPASPHYYERVTEKNNQQKTKTLLYFNSSFYAAFQKYISLCESCYQCRFASGDRASDLTIGDFHEVDEYISGINRFHGISRVFINTPKGKELLTKIKDKLWIREMDFSLLDKNGHGFGQMTSRPASRDEFIRQYKAGGIAALVKGPLSRKQYRIDNIYYHSPQFIRKILMRFVGGK